MKNIFLVLLGMLVMTSIAVASVNIYSEGQNYGPAQDINIVGASTSGINTPYKVIDVTSINDDVEIDGKIYIDETLYNGTITVGNMTGRTVIAGAASVDPCPGLGRGAIFINAITGAPCFCNSLGVDLSLYNGTTACF